MFLRLLFCNKSVSVFVIVFFTHRHAVDIIFMIIRYVYADWWTLDIDILLTLLDSPFTVKHTAYLIFYGAQKIIVSVYICMYFDFNFGFSIWIHIFHRRSYSCNFESEWNFPVHSFGKFTKFSRWIKHTQCSYMLHRRLCAHGIPFSFRGWMQGNLLKM